ncbi:hypothetical protein C2G38_2296948 [Gigaspora rosea]|uniref:Uncharacterized protein n=1 Tax=Gigaspora rosea TaxID=44941 RepID=A0A397VJU6_9GLOM|nr:hypothetical protein C2G38_2296948 [Gigaspora rosea]
MTIDIDNHITNSGSYYRFQKWLEELSNHEETLPEGLLFLAFDNEQKGQKNYLDRGSNTVVYHIVTSFVVFNMALQNRIQHTNLPWVCQSLSRSQYEELFDISFRMQEIVDKELHAYLAEILNLLSAERSSSTNIIDSFVASTTTNTTNMKMCLGCGRQNIENRKRICPECKTIVEAESSTVDQLNDPFIFKPYNINEEQINTCASKISFTQQKVTDPRVNIPEIYIPDPININPNSLANVEKVLLHIEKISGIKDGIRKCVVVICDGVLYRHTTKLREKFLWLVLIPGQLHEEMNMLRHMWS